MFKSSVIKCYAVGVSSKYCRPTTEKPYVAGNVVGDINVEFPKVQVELETVVHPRAELEAANLLIEWKIRDVHGAG